MALTYLSGNDYNDFLGASSATKNSVCRAGCDAKHPFKKDKRDACKNDCDAKYPPSSKQQERRESDNNPVAVFAGTPAREAFKLLVKLNVFKLADKLATMYKRDGGTKLKEFWKKWGGTNFSNLKKAIEQGSKSALGVDPTTVSAAIAAATPIVTAAVKLIKESGLLDKMEELDINKILDKNKQDIVSDPQIPITYADVPVDSAGVIAPTSSKLRTPKGFFNKGNKKAPTDKNLFEGQTFGLSNKKLLIGAGLVGGFIILKKMKVL